MEAGKIFPAVRVRQRRAISQATICCCCWAVNLRGSSWAETPAADAARPAVPTSRASTVTPRRQPPRLRLAGAALPSGPGGSGWVATRKCYGLSVPWRATRVSEPLIRRPGARSMRAIAGRMKGSVRGQRRIDLAGPGQDSPAHVDRVREAGVLDHGEALSAAGPALAVQHDPAVLRELLQGVPVEELVLGDEHRAGDRHDLVLVRLPDVDQEDLLVVVEHRLELGRGDRGPGRRALGILGHRAAERLVVDELGDRRVLAAHRALR